MATPAPARVVLFDSDVFPRTAETTDMLPGLIAYLERREASIRHLVARGDAFPTPSESPMLPALAAHLEQKEALLIASMQQEMQAATATPVAFATQQAARSNSGRPTAATRPAPDRRRGPFPCTGAARQRAMRVLAASRRSTRLRTSARVRCSCAPRLILASVSGSNSASSSSVTDSTVACRGISPPRM